MGHGVRADIDETRLSQISDLLRCEWAMYRFSLDLDAGPGAQAIRSSRRGFDSSGRNSCQISSWSCSRVRAKLSATPTLRRAP